jgi:hypothetical protein
MTIPIHSFPSRAQDPLDGRRRYAHCEEQRRARVAKIVDPQLRVHDLL